MLYRERDPFEEDLALIPDRLAPERKLAPREPLHLRRPDGELWAVEEGARLCVQHGDGGDNARMHLLVACQAWQGEAVGTKAELMNEPSVVI